MGTREHSVKEYKTKIKLYSSKALFTQALDNLANDFAHQKIVMGSKELKEIDKEAWSAQSDLDEALYDFRKSGGTEEEVQETTIWKRWILLDEFKWTGDDV